MFSKAAGSWISTASGDRYLDLLCGAGSLNYGHNDPRIMRPVVEYITAGGIVQSLDLHTEAKAAFLHAFESTILEPRNLDYKVQFPNATGANAVEAAIKLARKVTGRHMMAAFTHGFHGMSLGALALSGNSTARAGAGTPLPNVVFWPYDAGLESNGSTISHIAASLESTPESEWPAAAIIEMVQGEGGLSAAGGEWFRQLAALCRTYGLLLIVDDIQAGCGRSGAFFSFEGFGVVPDIVILSKSLSGFGSPFSVVLMRPELDIWLPGEHNGTFRGNNLAFVGAKAALDCYWRTPAFAESVKARAVMLNSELNRISQQASDQIKVKGRGLMVGLEFSKPELARVCSQELFAEGAIIETCGRRSQTLKLLPPLNISDTDMQFAVERIEKTVARVIRNKVLA
jgi:diaminobutyrate-2-oxoglutarate transaminase